MTQTMSRHGKPIFFPPSYTVDENGAIPSPAVADLDSIASEVGQGELLLFAKRLIDKARKQRRIEKYQHINPARIQLATRCLARALDDTSWPKEDS